MSLYDRLFNIFIPKTLSYDIKTEHTKEGYEIVTAINEAGEEITLQFPKTYKGLKWTSLKAHF